MALPDEPIDARQAATLSQVLARNAVSAAGAELGVFAAAAALRAAGDALTAAHNQELGAEARDQAAHARWRAAHDALLETSTGVVAALERRVQAGMEGAASLRDAITRDLARWADPYAGDAAGAPLLGALAEALAGAGPHLPVVVPLVGAVSGALREGQFRDRVEAERAAAIRHRVQAQARWWSALRALERVSGVELRSEAVRLAAATPVDAADDWFAAGGGLEE
jgi:hypothetical protein